MAQDAFEEIADTFEFLDDWEDRYRHVIDLGKAMEPLDESQKVPATKVEGCASQVWLVPEVEGRGGSAVFSVRWRKRCDDRAGIDRGVEGALFRADGGRGSEGRCPGRNWRGLV